ncbi:hypothetical protein Droror1_Dr00006697 [Drosera rotundifolia]
MSAFLSSALDVTLCRSLPQVTVLGTSGISGSLIHERSACLHILSYLYVASAQRTKPVGRRPICSAVGETLIKPVENQQMDAPKEIYLKDYKKPDYYFETVELKFLLDEEKTFVFSKISVIPRVEGSSFPLILNGQDLKLISLKVNGKELKEGEFQLDSRHLRLLSPPTVPKMWYGIQLNPGFLGIDLEYVSAS